MNKYCKKGTVEAEQFDGSQKMITKYDMSVGDIWGNKNRFSFLNPSGSMMLFIEISDYIVFDAQSQEYSVIPKNKFEAMYEKVKA